MEGPNNMTYTPKGLVNDTIRAPLNLILLPLLSLIIWDITKAFHKLESNNSMFQITQQASVSII